MRGRRYDQSAIANRLGDFEDIAELESGPQASDAELVEAILSVKNEAHNNYQDFQAFLEHGGRIGLQYDPLLYGAYTLNSYLVSVEMMPMLVVNRGQVAIVKAYVGDAASSCTSCAAQGAIHDRRADPSE